MNQSKLSKIRLSVLTVITFFAIACTTHQNDQGQIKAAPAEKKKEVKNLNVKFEQLASNRDVVCKMPIKNFLEDTILYEGKIYGFCGSGCKDEFKKDPKQYVK
ncbi:MAG: YHS domain-containing protein [Bacteroidia bacterium]